jgi:hypothetical protein
MKGLKCIKKMKTSATLMTKNTLPLLSEHPITGMAAQLDGRTSRNKQSCFDRGGIKKSA